MRKAADAKVASAELEKVARTYGVPREVGVIDRLLQEWHRLNGIVAWLGAQVAALGEDQLAWVDKKDTPQVDGLVSLFQEERRQLVGLGVQLVRLGFEERQQKVQEGQARVLAEAMLRVLAAPALGLSDEQRKAAAGLLRAELSGPA